MSKAYAAAFARIAKIPIFTEFDVWQPYDNSHPQELNLYIVRTNKTSLLCNQTYNLLCGCVLLKADRQQIEILAFKKPSSIIPVEYKKY